MPRSYHRAIKALALATLPFSSSVTASSTPVKRGPTPNINGFSAAGDSGVSAQMMFLGNANKVYILDKTENNPVTVNGLGGTHAAWAVEYDIDSNTYRTMDVESNTFCAGGGVLGNGTWVVFGGNQPVTLNGTGYNIETKQMGTFHDTDGGTAIRMIDPCTDQSCEWVQGDTEINYVSKGDPDSNWLQMTSRRWYPTIEVLADGTMIVIGGDINGGYVNTPQQDNPTYEFFPPQGNTPINLPFLNQTLPINLYPLTWLLPSGKLFMQANRATILYNYTSQTTTNLPNMPYAARVYPASAATAMLPLTPANNYTATLVFCGGSNPPAWGLDGGPGYNVTAVAADKTCVRITPDAPNPQYTDDDSMPEGRSMGQFVMLPDGTFWMGNGVAMGTAGYGISYSVGQSYGQAPLYTPAYYSPNAPAGQRWNRTGIQASPNERMYHSTAILLLDGSILVAGSNPNADFTTAQWRSRTDTERFYPWYYNMARPTLANNPKQLSYGGKSFDISLGNLTDETAVKTAKVVLIRGGFNTHAIGFGQRMIELQSTYTIDGPNKSSTLHVSQLPGNPGPTLFQPGPAMMFLVINGVPSQGQFIMVGSGQLGTQQTQANAALPATQVTLVPGQSTGGSNSSGAKSAGFKTTSSSLMTSGGGALLVMAGALIAAIM